MSDCVLKAICSHLQWLGVPDANFTDYRWAEELFYDYRQMAGVEPHENTSICLVPIIAYSIGTLYGLETTVEVDRSFTYEALLQMAHPSLERPFVLPLPMAVGITEGPGVYCGFYSKHALFHGGYAPMDDLIIMSVKYILKEKQNDPTS